MAAVQRSAGQAIALLLLLGSIVPGACHGFLSFPASRNIGNGVKNGYCQHCGNGNTNTCGDGNQWPRSSNYFRYADGPVTVIKDNILTVEIVITAHHKGHFEFSICDHQMLSVSPAQNQGCLNKYVLERVPPNVTYTDCRPNDRRGDCQPLDDLHKERWYLPPPGTGMTSEWTKTSFSNDVHTARFYIPEGLDCAGTCTLQWRWWTANSCTPKPDYKCYFDKMEEAGWASRDWCGSFCGTTCTNSASSENVHTAGCGEEFANCADIRFGGGEGAPITTSPTPPITFTRTTTPSQAPTPTTTLSPTPTPPSPTPMPTPTPSPTPNGCGSCTGCLWPNGVCYDDVDQSYCEQHAANDAMWCGGEGAPTTTPPTTPTTPTPTTTPSTTPAPTTTPSPTPTPPSPSPNECGSCTGCLFPSNGVCYTGADADQSYCEEQAAHGTVWCGEASLAAKKVAVKAHFLRPQTEDDAAMLQLGTTMYDGADIDHGAREEL